MAMSDDDIRLDEEPTAVDIGLSGDHLDYDRELEHLTDVIQKVQDKYIGQWMGSHLQQDTQNKLASHKSNVHKHSGTLSSLNQDLAKLEEQKEQFKIATTQQTEEVKALKEKLEQVKQETDRLLLEKEQAEKRLKATADELTKQQKVINEQSASTTENNKDLEASLLSFRKELGLQLKKISGDRVQLVFTHIDVKDPSRPFCFCVKINPDRTYNVTDCEPMITELDELVDQLNKTNNYKSFVITVRQKFQALVS